MNFREVPRTIRVPISILAGFLVLATARGASAHQFPAGCSGSGISISIMAFFADGVTSAVGVPASECETLVYKASIGYAAAPPGNCAFQDGHLIVTTPDGVEHDVTPMGGINVAGNPLSPVDPGPINGTPVTYVVSPADVVGGQVIASVSYNQSVNFPKGISHTGVMDGVGFNNGGSSVPVDVAPCPTTFCAPNVCDPSATDPVNFPGRMGLCVAGTPPVCPGDDCNTGRCDTATDMCVKDPVQDSTVCDSDAQGNPVVDNPGDCVHPGCEAGVCVPDHIPDPDSTTCTTVPDQPNDCVHPGCEAGVCVPNHITDPDSTVCGPDLDPTDAICPGCEGGVCIQDHIPCPKCGNRGDIRLASRRTPAQQAKAGTSLDALRIALRPLTTDVIDPTGKDITVEMSNANGVVYSTTLPAGSLTLSGRYYRYSNPDAKYAGGISRFTLWRKPNGRTQIYVDAWGNLGDATSQMNSAVIIGGVKYNHDGTWKPVPAGWRLPNSSGQ
jgi:hypothetical protein